MQQLKRKNAADAVEEAIQHYKKIILPIHWNRKHWLTVVIDVEDKKVILMDSMSVRSTSKRPNTQETSIKNVGFILTA